MWNLHDNLKMDISEEDIFVKLNRAKNTSEGLKNLKISKAGIAFIQQNTSKELYLNSEKLSKLIKKFVDIIRLLWEEKRYNVINLEKILVTYFRFLPFIILPYFK